MNRLVLILVSFSLLGLLLPAWSAGQEPAGSVAPSPKDVPETAADQVPQEVARLVKDLDADHFYTRTQAAARLQELAGKPQYKELLAVELAQVLVSAQTSLEVRKQVELLQRALPKTPPEPAGQITADELDHLIRRLENESYGARLSAMHRLEWFLGNPQSISRILVRLKERMAADRLSADAPIWLEQMYDQTRSAWLLTDPSLWKLPPVSADEIHRWTDDLVRSVPAGAPAAVRRAAQTAKRELWDVMARDEYVPLVKEVVERRLAGGALSQEAAGRLRELLDMTRPAMVAEYWEGHRHLGTQHLLVDVPNMTDGTIRPSHFDWINDKAAHCVTGSNLAPGEYPVGVAIAHPYRDGAIFHLVNLPTPRRRMAYKHEARTDEAKRLAALSRRTLNRYLRLKKPLARDELILLAQLDYREVSRFAGLFFQTVDDEALAPEELPFVNHYLPGSMRLNSVMQRVGGRSSRHGVVAALLAAEGTKEAIPGLLEAIAAGRILAPSGEPPRRLEWIAALAIAGRDPWPEVNAWLGGLVGQAMPLVEGADSAPDLGATAAGLLLKRHQEEPTRFGLETVNDELLTEAGLTGYRFPSADARQKVIAWWAKQKSP